MSMKPEESYALSKAYTNKKHTEVSSSLAQMTNKTAITLSHQFSDITARDTYFTNNPSELVDGLFIKVGTGYQQHLNSAWTVSSPVITEQVVASNQPISDADGLFNAENTEDALKELKLDTNFPVTNLITNSGFVSGSTGWITQNATLLDITDNTATVHPTAPSDITTPHLAINNNISFVLNNLYYGAAYVYGKATVKLLRSNQHFASKTTDDTWEIISGIRNEVAVSRRVGVSDTSATPVDFKVKHIIVINLTDTFGAGNEPTKEEMDKILSFYQNSWFDGTVNLAENKKMLKFLLNEIRSKENKSFESIITPTLTNSWIADVTPIGYYKKGNVVTLSGSLKTGTLGTSAFTLSSGNRPLHLIRRACVSNGAFGYVEIGTDGTVKLYGNNTYVSLDGISFRIDI